MATNSYKDLQVWQRAMDVAVGVYSICSQLPKYEQFGLADQLRRAAVSVPSNIAEGQKRTSRAETVHLTSIAQGSIAELETQLELVERIYAINTSNIRQDTEVVARMLTALGRALRSKLQDPSSTRGARP